MHVCVFRLAFARAFCSDAGVNSCCMRAHKTPTGNVINFAELGSALYVFHLFYAVSSPVRAVVIKVRDHCVHLLDRRIDDDGATLYSPNLPLASRLAAL